LCSYDGQEKVGDGFGFSVVGTLDDLQVFAGSIDTLMMGTVDQHMRAKEGMEKGTGQVVGRMEGVLFRMPVHVSIGYFTDRTAEIEVDELHALADAENGFLLFQKQMKGAKLLVFMSEVS